MKTNRRNFLKTLATGIGALLGSKALPENIVIQEIVKPPEIKLDPVDWSKVSFPEGMSGSMMCIGGFGLRKKDEK